MKQNNYTYKGKNIEKLSKKDLIKAYKEICDCVEIDHLQSINIKIVNLLEIIGVQVPKYKIELRDPKELEELLNN